MPSQGSVAENTRYATVLRERRIKFCKVYVWASSDVKRRELADKRRPTAVAIEIRRRTLKRI
jgi:hypothetical protein